MIKYLDFSKNKLLTLPFFYNNTFKHYFNFKFRTNSVMNFISNNIKLRGYFHDISSYDDYEPPYAKFTLLNKD